MAPNKYTWFLQEYGEAIAAIAWSKHRIDGIGAVTVAMFQNGNFKVGYRPRDRCSERVQSLLDSTDPNTSIVVRFQDGTVVQFSPDPPPEACYQKMNLRRSEFTARTTKNFRW